MQGGSLNNNYFLEYFGTGVILHRKVMDKGRIEAILGEVMGNVLTFAVTFLMKSLSFVHEFTHEYVKGYHGKKHFNKTSSEI